MVRPCSQSHHESTLPAQRYKATRQLPPTLNPIVPQDVQGQNGDRGPVDFPASFFEMNAPRARPPTLGNPIFGYSTHPIPAPVNAAAGALSPSGQKSPRDSTVSVQRIGELQNELAAERRLRRQLEAELASISDGMREGGKKGVEGAVR